MKTWDGVWPNVVDMEHVKPEDRIMTIHHQNGPLVYLFTHNRLANMATEADMVNEALIHGEIVDIGQDGDIFTQWWDGTNYDGLLPKEDPYILRKLGMMAHSIIDKETPDELNLKQGGAKKQTPPTTMRRKRVTLKG